MQNTGMEGSVPHAAGAGEQIAERAAAKLGRLSETAQQTMERLTQAAGRLGERTHALWDAQGPAIDKARTYAREHPLVTIGVAVAIGLILSRLLTRR